MNWCDELKKAFEENGEKFSRMVTTLSKEELFREFDGGYGGTEGDPFTAWGEKFVYFPICHGGSEWVGKAPRNPCDIEMRHQGGR